jgi:urease accessory protein
MLLSSNATKTFRPVSNRMFRYGYTKKLCCFPKGRIVACFSVPDVPCLSVLQLLQLADSALPVGSMSHSFGLEALVFDEDIETGVQGCPESLARYLADCLTEGLLIDAVSCREAHALARQGRPVSDLNRQISALKLARESRDASLTMGRRFAALAAALHPGPALNRLAKLEELHHSVAFGFTLSILAIDADLAVGAFLHQCVLNTISAAQRLLPLGQIKANLIAWDLNPAIGEAVKRTRNLPLSTVRSFAHLPEMAAMRHSHLPTRLFIS